MDLGIIVLGLVGLVVVLALAHVVTRMASERESAARRKYGTQRKQTHVTPFSNDTITHLGHS